MGLGPPTKNSGPPNQEASGWMNCFLFLALLVSVEVGHVPLTSRICALCRSRSGSLGPLNFLCAQPHYDFCLPYYSKLSLSVFPPPKNWPTIPLILQLQSQIAKIALYNCNCTISSIILLDYPQQQYRLPVLLACFLQFSIFPFSWLVKNLPIFLFQRKVHS